MTKENERSGCGYVVHRGNVKRYAECEYVDTWELGTFKDCPNPPKHILIKLVKLRLLNFRDPAAV